MFSSYFTKISFFLLRISMGWMMLYAGMTKVLDPNWTAAGYLKGAKTFSGFYVWLSSAANISWVNFINEWGLTLLGVSLLLGIFTRFSSSLGAILMLLYYFPVLDFPKVSEHGFIIDEHIIYFLVLLFFAALGAGRMWGIDGYLKRIPIIFRLRFLI